MWRLISAVCIYVPPVQASNPASVFECEPSQAFPSHLALRRLLVKVIPQWATSCYVRPPQARSHSHCLQVALRVELCCSSAHLLDPTSREISSLTTFKDLKVEVLRTLAILAVLSIQPPLLLARRLISNKTPLLRWDSMRRQHTIHSLKLRARRRQLGRSQRKKNSS